MLRARATLENEQTTMTKLSILDLCPITEGGSEAVSLANSRDLAVHAERWGYERFWLAEHHNMPGIASAATAVVIGHVAAGTRSIRVGAGGIMLPNQAPLVVAEQFGTLSALFPGRIDLGLGRAPGTDQRTSYALRRARQGDVDEFPQDVLELQRYLADPAPDMAVCAIPGRGQKVPMWILGSSLYGAQLAAALGLPYAFASHFAPAALMQALDVYRTRFEPSEQLDAPYAMAGLNMFAADTEEQAHRLRTSARKFTLNLRYGRPGPLPPPDDDFEAGLTAPERAMLDESGACSAVGTPAMVRDQLRSFVDQTAVDEVMLATMIYDHDARLRSLEIAMREWRTTSQAA